MVGKEGFGLDSKLNAKKGNTNKQIWMYILSSHDKGVGKNMIISLDLEGAVQNYYKKIIQIVNLSWGLLWSVMDVEVEGHQEKHLGWWDWIKVDS
jgi:hypothetical protein